jgi:capsular exopolysaccharide synthesis family protein
MTTPDTMDKILAVEGVDFVEKVVNQGRIADPLRADALAPSSPFFEQFRVLRAKVKAIGNERPFQCVGIMGATAGEGKTTVAVGLALALSEDHRRVLLIEAELRDPVLAPALGLVPNGGLSNWLRAEGARPVPIRRLEPSGLRVLAGGSRVSAPADLLGGDRMVKLLEFARRSFDYVIIDCPPLVPVADTLGLQQLLDGALLVVRARHAFQDTILRAHAHLKPNLVAGVVFNDQREIVTRRLGRNDRVPPRR